MTSFKPAAVLLHTVATAIMAYGWFGLKEIPNNNWIERQKGGQFQYLTIQGLVVAWMTMSLSLIADLVPGFKAVRAVKRGLFMIAMPLAVVISTIYWGLLLFMPDLILRAPEAGEWEPTSKSEAPALIHIPLKLDLSLHAIPGLALILDFFLFERRYTKAHAVRGGAAVAVLAGVWYGCWVEYCASYNGIFPYPFLTFNPLPIRVAIYAGATTFAYLFFLSLNWLHR